MQHANPKVRPTKNRGGDPGGAGLSKKAPAKRTVVPTAGQKLGSHRPLSPLSPPGAEPVLGMLERHVPRVETLLRPFGVEPGLFRDELSPLALFGPIAKAETGLSPCGCSFVSQCRVESSRVESRQTRTTTTTHENGGGEAGTGRDRERRDQGWAFRSKYSRKTIQKTGAVSASSRRSHVVTEGNLVFACPTQQLPATHGGTKRQNVLHCTTPAEETTGAHAVGKRRRRVPRLLRETSFLRTYPFRSTPKQHPRQANKRGNNNNKSGG